MLLATIIARSRPSDTIEVLLVVGGLIILLMIGGTGIMIFRRKLLSGDHAAPQHSSILDQLRTAFESGQLSSDEYERARRAIVDRARGAEPIRREPIAEPSQRWDRRAEPGVDLTGDSLPRPGESASGGSGGGSGGGSDNEDGAGE